jgi:hypothetical protein
MGNHSAGSELFTNYGKQWFKDRHMKRSTPVVDSSMSYTLDELKAWGHCLTDIHVAESAIPFAGKGVFASKSFRQGEVVSVSPVLVLPRHALEMEAEHSVLLNYCITSPDLPATAAAAATAPTATSDADADADATAADAADADAPAVDAMEAGEEVAAPANASDVALLPLGQAGMMNHGAAGVANVVMDW